MILKMKVIMKFKKDKLKFYKYNIYKINGKL